MKLKVSCKPSIAHIDKPLESAIEDISKTLIESSHNNSLIETPHNNSFIDSSHNNSFKHSFINTYTECPTEDTSTYSAEETIALLEGNTSGQEAPETRTRSTLWELGRLAIKIAIISVCLLLIFSFLYGFHRNTDPDMAPMVKDGDLLLYYRLDKHYSVGDLLLLDFQGERQVRRVVARAGDTVDITQDGLIINGGLRREPEIYQQTLPYENGTSFPLTVGDGQVFTLGDARENATDSRVYGPIDMKDTLGTVITVMRRRGL
jgi:signal peptidase I